MVYAHFLNEVWLSFILKSSPFLRHNEVIHVATEFSHIFTDWMSVTSVLAIIETKPRSEVNSEATGTIAES